MKIRSIVPLAVLSLTGVLFYGSALAATLVIQYPALETACTTNTTSSLVIVNGIQAKFSQGAPKVEKWFWVFVPWESHAGAGECLTSSTLTLTMKSVKFNSSNHQVATATFSDGKKSATYYLFASISDMIKTCADIGNNQIQCDS